MEHIRKRPNNIIELALDILMCLVNAKWTLIIDELREALSIKRGQRELDRLDLRDNTTILDVCGSLVTIDGKGNTIRLAHYTVQEYLLRSSVLPEDSGLRLSMACITYLSFDTFTKSVYTSQDRSAAHLFGLHPFQRYAAQFLGDHINPDACDEHLTVDILRFLGNSASIKSYLHAEWCEHCGYSRGGCQNCPRCLHVTGDSGEWVGKNWCACGFLSWRVASS